MMPSRRFLASWGKVAARSRLPLLASRTVSGHTLQQQQQLLTTKISTARQYFVPQGLYISQRQEAINNEKVWGLQVAPEKEEMVAALISLGSRANFGSEVELCCSHVDAQRISLSHPEHNDVSLEIPERNYAVISSQRGRTPIDIRHHRLD